MYYSYHDLRREFNRELKAHESEKFSLKYIFNRNKWNQMKEEIEKKQERLEKKYDDYRNGEECMKVLRYAMGRHWYFWRNPKASRKNANFPIRHGVYDAIFFP